MPLASAPLDQGLVDRDRSPSAQTELSAAPSPAQPLMPESLRSIAVFWNRRVPWDSFGIRVDFSLGLNQKYDLNMKLQLIKDFQCIEPLESLKRVLYSTLYVWQARCMVALSPDSSRDTA